MSKKMNTLNFLFYFSVILNVLLIFCLKNQRKYKIWYKTLLIHPESELRVQRFFIEIESTLKKLYPLLGELKEKKGRPITDPEFQFRFLIWWKFFCPEKLEVAIRRLNESTFLKKVLKMPIECYSSKRFKYFSKKLGSGKIKNMQGELIRKFEMKGLLKLKEVIIDSFPVKSILNTQKCLKRPKIDLEQIKTFLIALDVTEILKILEISPKRLPNMETKLKALLVKEIWDFPSWNKCWTILFGKEAEKINLKLSYHYKSSGPLRDIQKFLKNHIDGQIAEKKLIELAVNTLEILKFQKKSWNPKTLKDLNGFWYIPHRWRDPGISLGHCSSKDLEQYGRGGIIAVIEDLELPISVELTPKYKQSKSEILKFFQNLFFRFSISFNSIKVLGDSEFGFDSLRDLIRNFFMGTPIFPNYGNSSEKIKITKEEKTTRKMVERVIGRLVKNWNLEHPDFVGEDYADFHLQVAVFCDLLQVDFNLSKGNLGHPHALVTIRG